MFKKLTFRHSTILGLISLTLLMVAAMLFRFQVFSKGQDKLQDSRFSFSFTESVRVIPFVANDIVYNPADEKLYASIPGSVEGTGNSIQQIDPRTLEVGSPVYIGSEPDKLAMANDGHTLYATLDGAYSVRRFDTSSQAPGVQFPMGVEIFVSEIADRYRPGELAVSPDNPNVLAVGRHSGVNPQNLTGTAIFDGSVELPLTGPYYGSELSSNLTFASSGTVLFSSGQSGLRKMNVGNTGISSFVNIPLCSNMRIKFAGSRIYCSRGQVVDAETNALVGTIPNINSPSFVPDAAANRIVYLVDDTANGGNWLLKVYDTSDLTLVGTLPISNVSGTAGSLVRWGGNGVAFRTTGGQLFVIQTTLISSSDPIPTPTNSPSPTPTPTSFASSFHYVPIAGNDVVFNPVNQKLYLSSPSSSGNNGNSIAVIDPFDAVLEKTIRIGSEPNRLSLSSNHQTLYIGLDGQRSIRKFDTSTETPGTLFAAGLDQSAGPLAIQDFAASPDTPNLIAAARRSTDSTATEGVALYDDGIPRTQVRGEDTSSIAFSDSSSTIFGLNYTSKPKLEIMTTSANGVTGYRRAQFLAAGVIRYSRGLVYSASGEVIDPASLSIPGTFSFGGQSSPAPVFVIDSENNKAFYLTHDAGGFTIRAFDTNNYVFLGGISVPGASAPTAMKRWGKNGLAITQLGGPLILVQTALVNSSAPVPQTSLPPTPTPSPTPFPAFTRKLQQPNNDLIFNSFDSRIYASVPFSPPSIYENSIVGINPTSGQIETGEEVGLEPDCLAKSVDGQTLYVSLRGTNTVRRFDVPTQTPGPEFTPENNGRPTLKLAVSPVSANTVIVAAGNAGAAIYDNGVKRPNVPREVPNPVFLAWMNQVFYSDITGLVYGYNGDSTANSLFRIGVDPNGLNTRSQQHNLVSNIFGVNSLAYAEGKMFSSDGLVTDPETNRVLGTFGALGSAITIDISLRKAFIAAQGLVSVFDVDTYLKLATIRIPTDGSPTKIVRWGRNGLALRMSISTNNNYIYLIQSPAVSSEHVRADFDGDGKTDISVFRPGDTNWYIYASTAGVRITAFGNASDSLAPGDYDGDGKADAAVFRESTGEWQVLRSSDSTVSLLTLGMPGDKPVAGDYDGDGKTDQAIYRPSQGLWAIYRSSDGTVMLAGWGNATDRPVPSDYDGDGKTDIGVYRDGDWYVYQSTAGPLIANWGVATDKPVPADYDGDSKDDLAIYRPSGGLWAVYKSSDNTVMLAQWGNATDAPVPGDYDGDGSDDCAVFRNGDWYAFQSTAGPLIASWGAAGDTPIPARYIP